MMKTLKKTFGLFFVLLFATTFFFPQYTAQAAAQDNCSWSNSGGKYCLLAPLGNYIGKDGVLDIAGGGLSAYLKALFNMGIVLATGLAVIMITMGGLKYVSTDAINGKSEGKEMIQQALIGLVLALMAVLILRQINPKLLSTELKVDPILTRSIQIVDVSLSNDKTTQQYAMGSKNPMIDTAGVVYLPDAGEGQAIGGGEVAIDYDGSPGSYKVVKDPNGDFLINGERYSSVGYENLANARSKSGAWVGVQTDSNGNPVVNSDGTLNPQLSYGNGRINGNVTPFVALSSQQLSTAQAMRPGFGLGDTVYLTANGRTIEAIYADNAGKRDTNYSEVSPAAATALGIGFNRRGTTGEGNVNQVTISIP